LRGFAIVEQDHTNLLVAASGKGNVGSQTGEEACGVSGAQQIDLRGSEVGREINPSRIIRSGSLW
jgi:hypothetical protein